jgi:hypothetical protein
VEIIGQAVLSGVIHSIRSDDKRFFTLLSDLVESGLLSANTAEIWADPGVRGQVFLMILRLLENSPTLPLEQGDIPYLQEIVRKALWVRNQLRSPELWSRVFKLIGLALPNPVSAAAIAGGKVNFAFLVRGGGYRYFVRYHDPVGKQFLQALEPSKAVQIYLTAEALFRTCLGDSGVVQSIFPVLGEASFSQSDDRDSDKLIVERIIIQPDYTRDEILLSDLARSDAPISKSQITKLLATPLATIHARSCGIVARARAPEASDRLALQLKNSRTLLKFPDENSYYLWLSKHNWISCLVMRALIEQPESIRSLLARVQLDRAQFLEKLRILWAESAGAAGESGSLLHLDHSPRNCFVDRQTMTVSRVFDFESVCVADPAYDLGLAVSSMLRDLSSPSSDETDLRRLSEAYLNRYSEVYSAILGAGVDPKLVLRARVFAGLAFWSMMNDPYYNSIDCKLPGEVIARITGDLLASGFGGFR